MKCHGLTCQLPKLVEPDWVAESTDDTHRGIHFACDTGCTWLCTYHNQTRVGQNRQSGIISLPFVIY